MNTSIEQIKEILLKDHNFIPTYYYRYERLEVKGLKELFKRVFNKIAIVLNYNDDNYQLFYARFKTLTKITSENEVEYTLNISQESYINFLINYSGICQINLHGKNDYRINNSLAVLKNKRDVKKVKSLTILL